MSVMTQSRTAGVPTNALTASVGLRLTDTDFVRIDGVHGPEDIVIDHETGVAYVSSQIRDSDSTRHVTGDIVRLDLNEERPTPRSVSGNVEEKVGLFHPHGLDLFVEPAAEGAERTPRLFVINHRGPRTHSIEVFDEVCDLVNDGTSRRRPVHRLVHRRTIADDGNLTDPNDLVAIGPRTVYVANDLGLRTPLLQWLEKSAAFFGVGFGTVVRGSFEDDETADETEFTEVAHGLSFAAGIAVDDRAAPKRMYVACAGNKDILAFRRDGERWARTHAIALDDHPDNLSRDADGRMWVAAHPNLLALQFYLSGLLTRAPSRIYCIDDPASPDACPRLVFSDDGDRISAASVAAVYRRADRWRLLIGAVAGHHLLLADLPPDWDTPTSECTRR